MPRAQVTRGPNQREGTDWDAPHSRTGGRPQGASTRASEARSRRLGEHWRVQPRLSSLLQIHTELEITPMNRYRDAHPALFTDIDLAEDRLRHITTIPREPHARREAARRNGQDQTR